MQYFFLFDIKFQAIKLLCRYLLWLITLHVLWYPKLAVRPVRVLNIHYQPEGWVTSRVSAWRCYIGQNARVGFGCWVVEGGMRAEDRLEAAICTLVFSDVLINIQVLIKNNCCLRPSFQSVSFNFVGSEMITVDTLQQRLPFCNSLKRRRIGRNAFMQ